MKQGFLSDSFISTNFGYPPEYSSGRFVLRKDVDVIPISFFYNFCFHPYINSVRYFISEEYKFLEEKEIEYFKKDIQVNSILFKLIVKCIENKRNGMLLLISNSLYLREIGTNSSIKDIKKGLNNTLLYFFNYNPSPKLKFLDSGINLKVSDVKQGMNGNLMLGGYSGSSFYYVGLNFLCRAHEEVLFALCVRRNRIKEFTLKVLLDEVITPDFFVIVVAKEITNQEKPKPFNLIVKSFLKKYEDSNIEIRYSQDYSLLEQENPKMLVRKSMQEINSSMSDLLLERSRNHFFY